MKRIGLISDTHSYLDPAIFKHLKECDEIWHAGDIGNLETADRLAQIAPLIAVHGNVDGQELRVIYPKHQRFKCEEVDVWITHIGGYPKRYDSNVKPEIFENTPQLFISGHSHILKVVFDKELNLLHINPGASGLEGFHKVQTLVKFVIEAKEIKDLQVVEFGKKSNR
ncbi:metallophosphoesterase family protein [Ancylomarina longa]|uniref:Phosphoesterase n=1 Tax=Ancylomarina longa TaxID=2487017 RepID=A0A434B056_9BACT|nr:metallophosphoesterase family protein [Ancylomarina longa]RUT80164.1 metallophosphoesterase [Ancylomarina longa]